MPLLSPGKLYDYLIGGEVVAVKIREPVRARYGRKQPQLVNVLIKKDGRTFTIETLDANKSLFIARGAD